MAYGDLKVRNLIWNTGSGDNTVVLSTLATQSYVTTNFAPKSAPTFAGTINGVDLILSGNLTVSGTQTIINTNVLQVEDKHIEIGKVSTPSDTTADGGGIILKASSDRTFVWINSTDAWTSSEHIQVASGKTFIGDGSTLTALNATNLASGTVPTARLGSGTASSSNYLRGDGSWQTIDLSSKANLSGATFTGDISLGDNNITNVGEISLDKIKPDNGANFTVNVGTDKTLQFSGSIGEIGDVAGFQATNDALSANTSFGIRATDIRLATGNAERFRVGSAGQFGVGGATYGTSGQVLTSGGASAAPSWTTISSAPQITATANGSITANEAIIVESDGKVAGITGVSASLGTEQEYYNGRVRQHMCAFDSTTGKSVHVYANDGNQNQLYARVGTISGTGISYGSAIAVSDTSNSNLTFEYGCSVACGNGKVVVVLANSAGGGNISARAGTISGTSISFGSTVTLQGGPTNSSTDICYDSDKDKFVVLLSNNDTGNQCESQILTVSGNSLSQVDGGRVVSNSGDDACFINVVYVPEKTAYFAVYCNSTGEEPRTGHAGAGLAKGVVGTINGAGNQLTWGSASTLGSDNKNNLSIAYVPSIEKVAMVYLDRYSQYRLESLVVAVDWTNKTMSIGNYSVIESTGNSDYQPIVACLNDNEPKIVVAYKHSPGLVNNIGTVNTSNNTISYAGRQTIDSGGDIRVGSAWGKRVYPKIASGKFMLSAVDYSANKTWSLIQQFASTDLTTQNFIGFASAGYSNGNTATINIAGNTTTQSSLTPGKKYYVQQDGSLSLTADTPSVEAGTAVAATKLLIKG